MLRLVSDWWRHISGQAELDEARKENAMERELTEQAKEKTAERINEIIDHFHRAVEPHDK